MSRSRGHTWATCALAAWLLSGFAASAPSPPPALLELLDANHDDPRAALATAQAKMAAPASPGLRFWLLLASARSHRLLDDPRSEREDVDEAGKVPLPPAAVDPNPGLWLEHARLLASIGQEAPARVLARMAALRDTLRAQGDERLRCEFADTEAWLLTENASFDEAWLAAEELERCARRLKLPYLEATALATMGSVAAAAGSPRSRATAGGGNAVDHFARALAVLEHRPARFRRSLIEYGMGVAQLDEKMHATALLHLRRALEGSRAIGDRAGIAAANVAIARVHLETGDLAPMAGLLDESRRLLADTDDGTRMSEVVTLRVQALARERRPEVLAEIDYARRWDRAGLPPRVRARLARAIADGYASQGLWQRAYAELERAQAHDNAGKEQARDVQVLRLQSRYETMRRDAENAALRHRTETAQLALDAQTARQRALWLAVAALAMLTTSVGAFAWRGWQRRRTLLELALRDPLTGNPNRRAVLAYAQAQFEQMQRLSMPLSIAMIDLDHFKRVNDTHGHAAGDELLRAFATAGGEVLRGQDRLGRWGGEEWLLVMPGTPGAELPHVFERLRQRFAAMNVPGMPSPHGCTFSMGGATAEVGDHASLAALIERADARLYRAKADGRDAVR